MVSANYQNMNIYNTSGVQNSIRHDKPVCSKPIAQSTPSPQFKAQAYTSAVDVRTSLTTKDEKKKYNELASKLDLKSRKNLEYALKTGILLKNNSDDNSSVLDNLYKIMTEERDPGLDKTTILKECLDIIANPYVITQTCEDIPKEYKRAVIGLITNLSEDRNEIEKTNYELDTMHTGTCPTASIEFDLATKNPAEFFRMVEGLTSKNNATTKVIDLASLSDKTLDAVWLLNKFKTPSDTRYSNTPPINIAEYATFATLSVLSKG